MAGALLIAVGGNTNTLIPLFAIGVFIGFTLSQAGLVVHWRRDRPPAGGGEPSSTAPARASRQSPPSSSSSPNSPRAPGSSSSPSRPSSCSSCAFTPTTSGPARTSASTRTPEARAQAHHRRRAGEPDLEAHRARTGRGRVTRPGGHRRERRPRRRRRGQPRTSSSLREDWNRWDCGRAAHGCCTPTTPRSSAHRRLHRQAAEEHPEDQLVVLIPVCGRPSCATGSSTTRSTSSSPRHCAVATTSWWPGSRAARARTRAEYDRAEARPDARSQQALTRGSAALPHGVALLDEGGGALLASSLPNTSGCHSAASTARLARGPSTPCAPSAWSPAVPVARSRDPLGQRHRGVEHLGLGTTWLISPRDSARRRQWGRPSA